MKSIANASAIKFKFSIVHLIMFDHFYNHTQLMLLFLHLSSIGSWPYKKVMQCTYTGRWTPTGMKESIMGEQGSFPPAMWRCVHLYANETLCIIFFSFKHVPMFSFQIIPPTEKPTPIKSPTIQVLEYGEAVALFNFNADLPVELSFRKVPETLHHILQLTGCEKLIIIK